MSIAEKLTTIAENMQTVYDKGFTDGYEDGHSEGYYEGDQDAYNTFWDNYQNYGNRTNYYVGFNGEYWNDHTFLPKYPIAPINCNNTFSGMTASGDLTKKCDLDLSNATITASAFYGCKYITHLGMLDVRKSTNIRSLFNGCRDLQEIGLLKLNSDGVEDFSSVFLNCKSLLSVTIEGTIAGDVSFAQSPLNKESIISVINALSDSTADRTVTFLKSAVNTAFGIDIDDESTYPEESEFYILRNLKSNWTFSYV